MWVIDEKEITSRKHLADSCLLLEDMQTGAMGEPIQLDHHAYLLVPSNPLASHTHTHTLVRVGSSTSPV